MIYVVIGAYNAHNFIEGCLNSIARQSKPVKILLGIDGCRKTLEVVRRIMADYDMDVYFYPQNRGVYVTINTLIAKVPDDAWYMWWGADDYMDDEMCEIMWENKPCYSHYSAPHILSKEDFNRLGGFMPWRVGADTEFRQRLYKIRPEHKWMPVMWRRNLHRDQLTANKDSGFGSEMRAEAMRYIQQTKNSDVIYIEPVTHDKEQVVQRKLT